VRAKNTARVLVPALPQLTTEVELPEGANDQRLLSVMRQFIDAIGPCAEEFAAHGITMDELRQVSTTSKARSTSMNCGAGSRGRLGSRFEGSMTRRCRRWRR
jgi:hypothetical protein